MLNLDWHEAHKMPDNPTLDQRIAWHVEHLQNCKCRDMPDTIKRALEERGIALPKRKTD